MKRLFALSALAMLAACDQQQAAETEPVGKYVIYQQSGQIGSIRLNTVTGDTSMLIVNEADALQDGGVTFDGKPLVWRKINSSTAL